MSVGEKIGRPDLQCLISTDFIKKSVGKPTKKATIEIQVKGAIFGRSGKKGFSRLIKRDRNAGFTWYLRTVLPDWWFFKVELIVAIWCWARFVYQCLYLSNTTRWEIIASWWQQIHSGVLILSNEVMQKMTLLQISLAFLLSLNSLTILIFNAQSTGTV